MHTKLAHTILARLALGVGAAATLATGADHLDEYAANHFSTVPTIGLAAIRIPSRRYHGTLTV